MAGGPDIEILVKRLAALKIPIKPSDIFEKEMKILEK